MASSQHLIRASFAQKPGKSRAALAFNASKSAFFTFAWATNSRGGSKILCSCDTDSIVDMLSSPPENLARADGIAASLLGAV
jgi:hypothetical protein